MVRARELDMDFDNDADVRVLLLVHDTKPPFLDGRYLFTKQKGELSLFHPLLCWCRTAPVSAAVDRSCSLSGLLRGCCSSSSLVHPCLLACLHVTATFTCYPPR